MRRDLEAMAREEFDLLIIGGGVHGTGIARDAALRGLKTALVEKEDFGYGTTSRSTRLIHGGLRYLELLDFKLVREALKEREVLLHIAPHLVKPLEFITPIYRGDRYSPTMVKLGMVLYDLLSWDKSLPRHRRLSPRRVLELEPGLRHDGLRGGMLYYDCQVDYPERLCVENALDAAAHGAQLANHATVIRFLRQDNKVTGAVVRDELSGREYEIRAKLTINATGPWVDQLNAQLGIPALLRKTKGIHLVTQKFTNHAIVMLAKRDGRVFFAIPWRGYGLIGTTDTDFENSLDTIAAQGDEIDYLLEETKRFFPALQPEVYYTIAGVRSLIYLKDVPPSRVPRGHKIVDHREHGLPGLFSLLGGKLTTYRELAREVVELVGRELGRVLPRCRTAEEPLPGGRLSGRSWERYKTALTDRARELGLEEAQAEQLVQLYGARAERILGLIEEKRKRAEPLCPGYPAIKAQLVYCVREEMVRESADFLLRRTGIGLERGLGLDCVRQVSQLLAELLGWDDAQVARDLQRYQEFVALMERPAKSGSIRQEVGRARSP